MSNVDSTVLDMALTLLPILHYLSHRGVARIDAEYFLEADEQHITLFQNLFKELFPDVKPDADGWAETEYSGVKIKSFFPEVADEEASN